MRNAAMLAALAIAATVCLSWSGGSELYLQTEQYTVKQGQTVWEIACECLPRQNKTRDVRELMWDIKEHNHLRNYCIHAGDVLVIPLYTKK